MKRLLSWPAITGAVSACRVRSRCAQVIVRAFLLITLSVAVLAGQSVLANDIANDINDFPDVEVNGLFGGQAVLTINGKQRLLKPGQRSPEGVMLVSSNLDRAVLKYRGNQRTLRLSQRVAGSYERVQKKAITIAADTLGQYRVQVNISGQPVGCLVDTGASIIAMSSVQADRLGINYLAGEQGKVVTANGRATSYFVTLPQVTLGGIVQRNVRAAVVRGFYPEEVLLGMSFLSGLSLAENNGVMSITQKY